MSVSSELRIKVMGQLQGATMLQLAFVGVANGLFTALSKLGRATPEELASETGMDAGYLLRWCDAAYAFELLDEQGDCFVLAELGDAFRPEVLGTLMPFAVHAALAAHMAGRTAELMPTGERPGEQVLTELAPILPWFGPMLESMFGPLFEEQILPRIPVFRRINDGNGTVVDLGCGNGWYLRKLVENFPNLRGVGLDGFAENIRQASKFAQEARMADRLRFLKGDIYQFAIDEPVDLIVMNRALHHVWADKENIFRILKEHLKPGGTALIWEPNWPETRSALREPSRRGMAFQNLAEHVQGNHFLRPEEIQREFGRAGMESEVFLCMNDNEAVIVGTKA